MARRHVPSPALGRATLLVPRGNVGTWLDLRQCDLSRYFGTCLLVEFVHCRSLVSTDVDPMDRHVQSAVPLKDAHVLSLYFVGFCAYSLDLCEQYSVLHRWVLVS